MEDNAKFKGVFKIWRKNIRLSLFSLQNIHFSFITNTISTIRNINLEKHKYRNINIFKINFGLFLYERTKKLDFLFCLNCNYVPWKKKKVKWFWIGLSSATQMEKSTFKF